MITDSKFQHSGPSLPAVEDQRQLHPACPMGHCAGLPAWPPPTVCPTQSPSRGRGDGGLCGRGTGKEVSANGKKVPGSLSLILIKKISDTLGHNEIIMYLWG